MRSRPWLRYAIAVLIGIAVGLLVGRQLFLDDDDASPGDLVLTPEDLGPGWNLDASVPLSDDEAGLLGGCAAAGGNEGKDDGYFTALSDASGDVVTNEVRVLDNAADASNLFEAAHTAEATECLRVLVETEGVELLGAGGPVAAVVEPVAAPPWTDQTAAYRVRVDVGGVAQRRVDVYLIRQGPAVAVVQIVDQGEPAVATLATTAVRAMSEELVQTFGLE